MVAKTEWRVFCKDVMERVVFLGLGSFSSRESIIGWRPCRRQYSEELKPALRVRGCGRWGLSSGLGGCFQVVFEASGVDEAADGVAGQVAQSQGDAA